MIAFQSTLQTIQYVNSFSLCHRMWLIYRPEEKHTQHYSNSSTPCDSAVWWNQNSQWICGTSMQTNQSSKANFWEQM